MDIETLTNKIKEARPNLSASSLKSYKSILSSLYRQMNPRTDFDAMFFETHSKEVMDHLKNQTASNRKTRLSALVVACTAMNPECKIVDTYRSKMYEDSEKTRAQDRLQKKNAYQQENWIEWTDVVQFWEDMKRSTMPLWTKARLTPEEFNRLQDFVILSVYVLVNPPRRIQDYAKMKIRNANRQEDNYIDKQKTLVFHIFKTAKFLKKDEDGQRVEMPTSLRTIIAKWMKIQLQSDYLIVDTEGQPMSQSQLTMRLNKIFSQTGKRISVNMLRHSFYSHELKNVPSLVNLEQMADNAGHSVMKALEYVKR